LANGEDAFCLAKTGLLLDRQGRITPRLLRRRGVG
jgi:hypothetical protein